MTESKVQSKRRNGIFFNDQVQIILFSYDKTEVKPFEVKLEITKNVDCITS